MSKKKQRPAPKSAPLPSPRLGTLSTLREETARDLSSWGFADAAREVRAGSSVDYARTLVRGDVDALGALRDLDRSETAAGLTTDPVRAASAQQIEQRIAALQRSR